MSPVIRIGTRDSQLAVWQATQVSNLLTEHGFDNELVFIKSEGDIDLVTPLYEMGVQGIFTRSLDTALLAGRIDLAVHSMKDVPVVLPQGIAPAAILKRGSHSDLLVYKVNADFLHNPDFIATIATSSIRRKAQWLNRYPQHRIESLRGNVNTRLKKLDESDWNGAIFAAAGLERIGLRSPNALELDWMLPAPAQGAILVVARKEDHRALKACTHFHDEETAACVKAERDFLKTLMGGCSTPISALATIKEDRLVMKGNVLSLDGAEVITVEREAALATSYSLGVDAAFELLDNGGEKLLKEIRKVE